MNLMIKLMLGPAIIFAVAHVHAADTAQLAANKKLVVDFYNKALNEKDVDAAVSMLDTTYIQHNASIPDGREGFRQFFYEFRNKFPDSHSRIIRVIAEGDLVVLHVHMVNVPDTRGMAVMDIFRVENGKLVEHWDVLEPIPADIPHSNTMF